MTEGTSICLVTRDRPETLHATVEALLEFLGEPYEVILVDNGSTDPETLAVLDHCESRGWFVVRNSRNCGLSQATNQGLALGKYDCLIHLDDDALIQKAGWNQCMRGYLTYPKVGMVMPANPTEFIQQVGYKELRWWLGLCWAMRKELFDDIGGYDPQLLHQNEVDLCLRARMAGYHVAGIGDFSVHHNDPGGPRSDISLAREHLGCVQFRDKWASYHKGREWNYGTVPLYLSQHYPIEQEWYRQFALQRGVNLNPCPYVIEEVEKFQEQWAKIDAWAEQQKIKIGASEYLIYRELRNDYAHWEITDAYAVSRQQAIDRWYELTGERYGGYRWPNLLKPSEA